MEDQQRNMDRKTTSEGIPEVLKGISRASLQIRDLATTQDVCENTRMSKSTTTHVSVSYTDLVVNEELAGASSLHSLPSLQPLHPTGS